MMEGVNLDNREDREDQEDEFDHADPIGTASQRSDDNEEVKQVNAPITTAKVSLEDYLATWSRNILPTIVEGTVREQVRKVEETLPALVQSVMTESW